MARHLLLNLEVQALVLLLMTILASLAVGRPAKDPFAVYQDVLEERLAAMSEAGRAVSPATDETPASPEVKRVEAITVSGFARRFWGGREAELSVALSRLQQYRPTVENVLEREGVPKRLVAVVLVESGPQTMALSPNQARGLWQLTPATARQYGLEVSSYKDERVEVEQSTRAAAHYLRDLYQKFGDWPLALAAYNAGPDAVSLALRRGYATSYAQIGAARILARETRDYVPAVLSAMQLLGTGRLVVPELGITPQSVRIVYASTSVTN